MYTSLLAATSYSYKYYLESLRLYAAQLLPTPTLVIGHHRGSAASGAWEQEKNFEWVSSSVRVFASEANSGVNNQKFLNLSVATQVGTSLLLYFRNLFNFGLPK